MKRTWMLLLIVMVLSVLLAVPAMAAEDHVHGTCGDTTCCTHDDTWTALTADTTFTDGGKYYVPEGGLTAKLTVTGEISVTICLNGQNWTGTDNRPLSVTGGATVDLVDCSAQDETTKLSGGSLTGIDVTANSTPYGGTLYVSGGSVVNIYNGTLTGGTAGRGGNVYMTTAGSEINVYGGLITGGTARIGGNIFVNNGTLTVDGEYAVISAGRTTKDVTAVTDDPNGGNVYQSAGTIKLKAGTVKDGVAVNTAGNVRVGGTFEMSGGTIINGASGTSASKTSETSNMQIVGPGISVSFTGGHVHGYISVHNTKAIKVSGSAKIYAADEAGTILNNGGIALGYAASTTDGVTTVSRDSYLVIDGTLNSDAKIAVTKTVGQKVLASVGTADEWRAYEAYLRSGQITCSNTSRTVTFEADGMYSRSGVWHCYCGYVNGKHDRGCNEYDVEWTAWSGGTIEKSGNFYMTGDLTTGQNRIGKNYENVTETAYDVVIDLNGYSLTSTSRAFQVRTDANFTLCNSKATGGIVTGSGLSGTNDGTNYGVVQFMGSVTAGSTMSMMRGVTLRFDDQYDRMKTYAVLSCSATFNMYGGTIIGAQEAGEVSFTYSGAVGIGAGVFTMYPEATIYGGTAVKGGAVYMTGGEFNCIGGKIIGGVSEGNSGGMIFLNGGTFKAEQGATITALDENNSVIASAKNGAVAYVSGTGEFILDNSTMVGGNVTNTGAVLYMDGGSFIARNGSVITGGTSDASAGALSLSGGTFTLDGSTINGGTAPSGGAVYVWEYNSKSGTFVMQNGATLNGGDVSKGGAVYISGGSFTCNGGTINGSTINGQGGAVYISGGTFNLYNGTITGGKATNTSEEVYGGNVYMSGGTFNAMPTPDGAGANDERLITGGTAYSTAANAKGGNFYVVGGTLNLNGTTVSDGTAEYAGTASRYAYGGNIYVNADVTVALSNGAVVSGGTTKTTHTWAPGGNIMLDNGNLTIDGAATTITGGATITKSATTAPGVSDSHNLYINSSAEVTMNDGLIENTEDGAASILIQAGKLTVNGGELVVRSTGTRNINGNKNPSTSATPTGMLTINGGKIHGGNVTGAGGNIYLEARVNFEMTGGEVYDGTAGTSGGNIYFGGTASLTISEVVHTFTQEIAISGGKIYDGTATNKGGNVYVGATALVTVSGGEITGGTATDSGDGLYMNGASLTMSGAPKITGNTASNLYLPAGKVIAIGGGGMTSGANVGVTCADAEAGREVTGAVEDINTAVGFGSDDGEYAVRYNSTDKVMELSTDLSGAVVNGSGAVYDLTTAIGLAGENDFVQLTGDYKTDVTVNKNLYLDLNGYTISGNVTVNDGYTLKLFDTATADYSVDKDANGKTYGKITGTISGTVARTMNTPKATYGGNYRYVVIKDDAGYHSHRFYMTVKSTVLYPTKPALNYRTVLRCDAVVAQYINADGGAYGVRVKGWDTAAGAYTQEEGVELVTYGKYATAVNKWDGSDDNNRVSQLENILSTSDELATQIYKAETVQMHACAYFQLADQFGGGEIVSSTVKKSMMDMVKAADAMTGLSKVQMATLGAMYNSYSALMGQSTWSLSNIPNYNQGNLVYYCMCGDPSSTNNPCAAKGHMAIAWEPWEKTDSLPTEEGNWYLTGNVTLSGQLDLKEQQFVCIDTRGFTITSGNRIALVRDGAVLNLVNSTDTESVLTAKGMAYNGTEGGDSGALLILGGGNMSIYDGIKLTLSDDHVVGKGGVATAHGDLNIYGGTLVGVELIREAVTIGETERDYTKQSGNGNGGAVLVSGNGYLFMNNGTIIGGQDSGAGAAIYSNGTVELEGDAVIQAGTAANGGLLAITGGTFTVTDMELTGGTATTMGGAVYISAGHLTLDGATITGGSAPQGGAIAALDTGIVTVDGGTVKDGTAIRDKEGKNYGFGSNFFVSDSAQVNIINASTVSGGMMQNIDTSGTGDTNDYGGSAVYMDGGTVTVTDSTLTGYTGANVCKRGGTVLMKGGTFNLNNSTLSAAKATVNGAAVLVSGGTFKMTGENAEIDASAIACTYGSAVSMKGTSYFVMENGTILGGETKGYGDTHGGAIDMGGNSQFTMNGGTISGGRHTHASKCGGGNVLVRGNEGKCFFKMTGGTIQNGSSTTVGGNVYVMTGTFEMTGGTVTGGTANGNGGGLYAKGGTVKLSGTAKITGNNGSNVYLADSELLTLGALTEGADVNVTLDTAGGYLSTAAGVNADNLTYVHSDEGYDKGYDSDSTQLYIGKLACLCGAYGDEEHLGTCQGDKLVWTPWTTTNTMPTAAGYWYLPKGTYTVTSQARIGDNTTDDVDVFLDLNGQTVSCKNGRIYSMWDNGTDANGNYSLTLTDSTQAHAGKLEVTTEGTRTDQGMAVWIRGSWGTLNLYRANIDVSGATLSKVVDPDTGKISNRNGVAIDNAGGTINMYAGSIIGGTTEGFGGAISTSGTFTMSGGSISGGTATGYVAYELGDVWYATEVEGSTIGHNCGDGGNIRNSGTMTVTGGSISGGVAYSGGGNIDNAGTLTVSGSAQITGGTASGGSTDYDNGYGGNINSSKALTISDVTITGGTATPGSAGGGGLGGNICAGGGTVNLTGVTLTGGQAETGGNLGANASGANVTLDSVTMTGGIAADMGGNIAVNVRPIAGFTIKGNTSITGGQAKNGGNIGVSMWLAGGSSATVTMESGSVSGGTATGNGGNVYLTSSKADYVPTFNLTGGTVSGGSAEGTGNNIYFGSNTAGTLAGNVINTVDGTADKIRTNVYVSSASSNVTMTGGVIENQLAEDGSYALSYARNVYMANGTFTMEGGEIRNARSLKGNGGNVFVAGGTFNLEDGTVSGGVTNDTGGNIYLNGKVNISGGLVTRGYAKTDDLEHNASNIQCVNGELTISGGQIDGGINVNNWSGGAASATNNCLILSGSPKILGVGINLTSGNDSSTDADGKTVTTARPLPYLDFTGLNADAVVHITSDRTTYTNKGVLIYTDTANAVYTSKVFVECLPETCQVAYLEDGVYLYNGEQVRFQCACGANSDEAHLGGCTGAEVRWNVWTSTTMPTTPGYWFLNYTNGIKTNSAGESYVKTGTSAYKADYILDSTTGEYTAVYSVLALDEYGDVQADDEGYYVPNGELVDDDGNLVGYTSAFTGTKTAGIPDVTLVDSYDIHLDLNGFNLDANSRYISFYGRSTKGSYTTHRQADVNLTIVDSSQDHVAVAATDGTFSGENYASEPQGGLIWMPHRNDSLTTCYTTLSAKSANKGWGLVLDTQGTVNFWSSQLIGGTSKGYTKTTSTDWTVEGVAQEAVDVVSVTGSSNGGGALCINQYANVTMHGGSITGGTVQYDYMEGDNGVGVDRGYGGGNVFINGGSFTMHGGTISGGKAIIGTEAADTDNHLPGSVYGVGGGVYVYDGSFNVSGNAQITGNTGADGSASNVFLNGHPVNVVGTLSSGANIGIDMTTYEGTYATTTVEANKAYFTCDDGVSRTGTYDSTDGKLYFAPANGSTYLVGYGSASIQPSDADLSAGLSLNGYGNTTQRTTNLLTLDQHHAATTKYNNAMLATALAITDGEGDTVILINADMASIGDTAVNKAKNLIHQATGVPMDNITIAASHQHSSPTVSTVYYKNTYGEYTDAAGNVLKPNQARVIKTDFASTFYDGMVKAAVAAFGDRKQSSVSIGTLDTTSGGDQYNFVRNVKVTRTNKLSGSTTIGMWTDNHKDFIPTNLEEILYDFTYAYESDIDTTMQLVKFSQTNGTDIVLANFQTHPHLAGGSTSYYVHSDVVGAFRNHLAADTGARVIYFSGASGDVNTSTKITEHESRYPYAGVTLTETESALQRIERAEIYGDKLAALAASYLGGTGMTAQSGTMDVEVTVREVTYQTMKNNASATAIANAKEIVDWETGAYKIDPTTFEDLYWEKFVGAHDKKEDRVYSAYHAARIRRRIIQDNAGIETGTINLTAYSLGTVGFVAAPYEMFQLNGQQIKANSTATGNYAMTIVSSIANGGNGYIPTSEAYDNGGYSTDISPFAKGTGEQMVNEFVDMLNELKGGN